MAVDEVQSLYTTSTYLTPEATPIESYHLATPSILLSLLSQKSIAKGMIIGSISNSTPNLPPTQTFLNALKLPTKRKVTPYTSIHPVYHDLAKNLEVFEVEGLSGKEAKGLFEIMSKKGWGKGDEGYLGAMMASGGTPAEFGRIATSI